MRSGAGLRKNKQASAPCCRPCARATPRRALFSMASCIHPLTATRPCCHQRLYSQAYKCLCLLLPDIEWPQSVCCQSVLNIALFWGMAACCFRDTRVVEFVHKPRCVPVLALSACTLSVLKELIHLLLVQEGTMSCHNFPLAPWLYQSSPPPSILSLSSHLRTARRRVAVRKIKWSLDADWLYPLFRTSLPLVLSYFKISFNTFYVFIKC